jgi:transposase InsO family protein
MPQNASYQRLAAKAIIHTDRLYRESAASLCSARAVTEAWREDYNRVRPQGALGNQTPSEFARPVAGHARPSALHGEQLGWYHVGGGVS